MLRAWEHMDLPDFRSRAYGVWGLMAYGTLNPTLDPADWGFWLATELLSKDVDAGNVQRRIEQLHISLIPDVHASQT